MSYLTIEQNDDKTFSFHFSSNFYNIFTPYYRGGSYFNILYRLFGLLPQDFYHMLGAKYHATFVPSKLVKFVIYTKFSNKADIINFANEVDKRINYLIKSADFK